MIYILFSPIGHISGIMPHYSLATGGYSLYVSTLQFIEAGKLLNSHQYNIYNKNLIDDLEEIQKHKDLDYCPSCGNKSLEVIFEPRKGLILILFLLFGVPLDEAKKEKKICHFCNKKIK